jgi:hypothetical protein
MPNIVVIVSDDMGYGIGETKNLAAEHPRKVKELIAAWQRWSTQLSKPLWSPRRDQG